MSTAQFPVLVPQQPAPPILTGQTAIVTGASSGVGQGIAITLAQAGADVVVNFNSSEKGAIATAEAITKLGRRAVICQANVTQEPDVEKLFAKALAEFGRLDILVNNAGKQNDAMLDEMTLAQWNDVLAVNLTSMFLCSREAVKIFKRQGINPAISVAAGKIVCISSIHDLIPWAGHVNYAASKGGALLFLKSLAQEVAIHRIRVNGISPGAIRTPINTPAWSTPAAYDELKKLILYKRIGEPEEVGRCAAWLASDQSDYLIGQTIYLDGGMALYPGFESGG
ncbi:MAG: glucose 1-dehydrogenase [Pirellulales bacterium]|nr:glucose 1-dehydrogenase [Pirellulales bacterium]